MTHIVDTSVWIAIFRDETGTFAKELEREIGPSTCLMIPPIRLELLQGCRGEKQWRVVSERVAAFDQGAVAPTVWDQAARVYFELRQRGVTPRSSLDCVIAEICIDLGSTLIHNDRDFEAIATIRPLKHVRLDLTKAAP